MNIHCVKLTEDWFKLFNFVSGEFWVIFFYDGFLAVCKQTGDLEDLSRNMTADNLNSVYFARRCLTVL